MSKLKNKFYTQLRQGGFCDDAARELDKNGLLSEKTCERYLIKERFKEARLKGRMVDDIIGELSDEFNKSIGVIRIIVYSK